MILIDKNAIFEGKLAESVLIKSFKEYKDKGGTRDELDAFSLLKERAKHYESLYVSYMDQSLSGIDVPEDAIYNAADLAQVYWYIIHLWFNKPLRMVHYSTFSLEEFNKL